MRIDVRMYLRYFQSLDSETISGRRSEPPPRGERPVQQRDFFDTLARAQSRRIDEQRSTMPEHYSMVSDGSRQSDTLLTFDSRKRARHQWINQLLH